MKLITENFNMQTYYYPIQIKVSKIFKSIYDSQVEMVKEIDARTLSTFCYGVEF